MTAADKLAQALRFAIQRLRTMHDWGGENQDRHYASWRWVAGSAAADCAAILAAYEAEQAAALKAEAVACVDPMCACRGGPCAECSEGEREKELDKLKSSLDFYKRRCEALQSCQSSMRDPERTMVCDILANGSLLMGGNGRLAKERYSPQPATSEPAPPAVERQPLTDEQAISIARDCAVAARDKDGNPHHDYLPMDGGSRWMPHAWVVEAIKRAHGIGKDGV